VATYWIDSPVSWSADDALHAGITRKSLQDNLICLQLNDGFDLNAHLLNSTDTAITTSINSSWSWVTEYIPQFIPVCRIAGGGWRDYAFSIEASSTAAGSIRVFLLDGPSSPLLDASTGLVENVSAYDDTSFTSGYSWSTTGNISLDHVGRQVFAGLIVPGVWIHLAAKKTTAGSITLSIRTIRKPEGAAI